MCDVEQTDEKCQICGLSPVLVPYFSTSLMMRIKEPDRNYEKERAKQMLAPGTNDKATWCPVSAATEREFLNDLAVVGMYRCRNRRGCEEFEEPRRHREDDHIDAQQVCLFTRLRCTDALNFYSQMAVERKEDGKRFKKLPGNARDTIDLEHKGRGTKKTSVRISASTGAYLVHTRCWELLQGYGKNLKRRHPTRCAVLTPAAFWRTGLVTSEGHRALRREGSNSFDWLDREEAKKLHDGARGFFFLESLPYDPKREYDSERARAIRHSLSDDGEIDVEIRAKLWDEIASWTWQPPDKVELLGGYDKPVFTLFDTSACLQSASHQARTSISSLPVEVIGLLVRCLDLPSAMQFAATNKTLRQGAIKVYDDVARFEIEERHPWMLPHTPREIRNWNAQLAQQKQELSSRTNNDAVLLSDAPIGWLAHMKACLRAPTDSMRNRRRIWKAAAAIFREAAQRGFLE